MCCLRWMGWWGAWSWKGPTPLWATSNPHALLSSCDLFGYAVCNQTGNLSAALEAGGFSEAELARWYANELSLCT